VLALLARRREVENEMREEGISVREKKVIFIITRRLYHCVG